MMKILITYLKILLILLVIVGNKIPDFTSLQDSSRVSVIIGTESRLKPDISTSEIFNDTWNVFRKNRNEVAVGGVFASIKKNTISTKLVTETDCEVVWYKMSLLGKT